MGGVELMGTSRTGGLTDALAQGPQLLVVEVGISLDTGAWGKGVCQESIFAVERVPISVL